MIEARQLAWYFNSLGIGASSGTLCNNTKSSCKVEVDVSRAARRASALRANLLRRKLQARARSESSEREVIEAVANNITDKKTKQ